MLAPVEFQTPMMRIPDRPRKAQVATTASSILAGNTRFSLLVVVLMTMLIVLTACNGTAPIPPIAPALVTSTAVITVENASTLVELAEFSEGDMGPVTALAFTPDNAQIRSVYAHNTPSLRHWSVTDHKMLAEYDLESVGLGAVAFDGNARTVVLAGVASETAFATSYMTGITPAQWKGPEDGVHFVDAENGKPLGFLHPSGETPKDFNGIAFSQDGLVVAVGQTNRLGFGSTEPGLLVLEVPPDLSMPASVLLSVPHYQFPHITDFALDVEGRLFAIYASNGVFQLWDLKSQQKWGTLELQMDQLDKKPDYRVHQVAISPTRQWLVAFSLDLANNSTRHNYRSQVTLWRLDKGSVQWQTETDFRILSAFAFNPTSTLLAAGTGDGVHIWNVVTGEEVKVFPGESALSIAFSPDGSQLAWGDYSGIIHLAGFLKE